MTSGSIFGFSPSPSDRSKMILTCFAIVLWLAHTLYTARVTEGLEASATRSIERQLSDDRFIREGAIVPVIPFAHSEDSLSVSVSLEPRYLHSLRGICDLPRFCEPGKFYKAKVTFKEGQVSHKTDYLMRLKSGRYWTIEKELKD